MNTEKEIVNFWLNKKGYFTINNIRTSTNRDVGIVAVMFEKGIIKEVIHVGVSCSISSNVSIDKKSVKDFINNRYLHKSIKSKVNNVIRKMVGSGIKPERVVVMPLTKLKRDVTKEVFATHDIKVIDFVDVIVDLLGFLDQHYYKSDYLRTLQVIKYILLSESDKAGDLIVDVLNQNTRPEFLLSLLKTDKMKKSLRRVKSEEDTLNLLKHSAMKKPDKLADFLVENILTSKTRRPFLMSLLSQEKMNKLFNELVESKSMKKVLKHDQKSLQSFFSS